MNSAMEKNISVTSILNFLDEKDAFTRISENDDGEYYSVDRFVQHLDSTALKTVESIAGALITDANPVILDLMASHDSHLSADITAARVTGLGLNENEISPR